MSNRSPREERQLIVGNWAVREFGHIEANSRPQRGLRLLEEAVELFQVCNGSKEIAHKLVDYVFSRPSGNVLQEIGGVSVTLLALGSAIGVDVDTQEFNEIVRILAKPQGHFTQRNKEKNDAGFLVVQEGLER